MDAKPPAPLPIQKRALLVGAAHYEDQASCPNLRAPVADVESMKRVLERPECGYSVATLIDPTRTTFAGSVEEMFGSARRGDWLLLYFSGHGKPFDGLHLCTTDTRDSRRDATSLAMSQIKQYIDPTKQLVTIILLDCCYSGQALAELKSNASDVPAAVADALWEDLGRPAGTYIMTSSSMRQVSKELSGDRNSLFTKWLVKGLESWEAARNNPDTIDLWGLYEYVLENVAKEDREQTPKFKGLTSAEVPVIVARRAGAVAEPGPTGALPYLRAVQIAIDNKQAIFFLGDGIYGDGPLSASQLIQGLGAASELDVRGLTCLPTAAEQFQRLLGDDRLSFLRTFGDIIRQQEEKAQTPAIHDMLAQLAPPWLVVSATHDLFLERRLEDQNLPFVVVTHILRDLPPDNEPQPNGKIYVFRRGPEAGGGEIVAADHLPDLSRDRVIYKLLGSPCLGQWRDSLSNVDLLDTVVATEDDHVMFVGLLRNERTDVPTAFSLPFKRKAVVFIGVTLDSWNHRLIATVLKKRVLDSNRAPFAVRKTKSRVEDLFWQGLHAQMIEVEPDFFVQQLKARTGG